MKFNMRLRSHAKKPPVPTLPPAAETSKRIVTQYNGTRYVAYRVRGEWHVGRVHFYNQHAKYGVLIPMVPSETEGRNHYVLTDKGTAMEARVSFGAGYVSVVPLKAKSVNRTGVRLIGALLYQVSNEKRDAVSSSPKPKGLIKSNYKGDMKLDDTFKRAQNNLIRLHALESFGGTTKQLYGVVLDAHGFRTSTALLSTLQERAVSIIVPNHSTDYVSMREELTTMTLDCRHSIQLVPGKMEVVVQSLSHLDFLVADTCGFWNQSLQDMLVDLFARGCLRNSLLTLTVNCRAVNREEVYLAMTGFVSALAVRHGCVFHIKDKLPYGPMLFVLGWVSYSPINLGLVRL